MDASLEQYQAQLFAVEQALKANSSSAEERSELESLKASLLELLELTKETQNASQTTTAENGEIDDEMQRFMSELRQLESEETKKSEDSDTSEESKEDGDVETKLQELKAQLEQLVGQKCAAPHKHAWGSVTYHNAIVCGVADNVDVGSDGTLEACVRILFTNPTHREMLPCSYYLEGECRFDEEQCHYSHGELVSASELRDYMEPNFDRLARNCVVLAKLQDRLWHRGRVLCANFIDKNCRVRLDGKGHKDREKDFAFEDLLPIYHDEDLSSDSSSVSSDDSDSGEMSDTKALQHAKLVEQSLLTVPANQPLGEWERYTKGIGSKLMAKMGYVHGTGLGNHGRGIITPISAQILPQGRSLDHCMELREAANGDKDLFSVEKKLHAQKRKQEALNARAYANAEKSRSDVFSFINQVCAGDQAENKSSANNGNKKRKNGITQQPEDTKKSLNAQLMCLADDIRRKEREIVKVRESIRRNSTGGEVHKRLQAQLDCKNGELKTLQKQESELSNEQSARRKKNELYSF